LDNAGIPERVAVTGADGFIGTWISAELEGAGYNVLRIVHTMRTPRDPRTITDTLAADVSDIDSLREALAGKKIGTIIHTASIRSTIADRNPLHTVAVNVEGVANVLELAREFSWRRSLILSSGSAYGAEDSAESPPLIETTPISAEPRGMYGATKAAADLISCAYLRTFGIDGAVIRLSRVYGPGRRERPLGVDRLLRQAHQGAPVELDEWTRRTRLDCTYIRDVAHAIRALCEADELPHGLYNVSGGNPITGEEIVTALSEIYPKMRVIEREATDETMYPDERPALSISLIENDVGWKPRYTLRAALRDYARHLDNFEHETALPVV